MSVIQKLNLQKSILSLFLMIAFSFFLCQNSFAQSVAKHQNDLKKIQAEISKEKERKAKLEKQQQELKGEIKDIQKKSVSIAGKVRSIEKKMTDVENNIKNLEKEKSQLKGEIGQNNAKSYQSMALLERMSLTPMQIILLNNKVNKNILRNSAVTVSVIQYLKYYNTNLSLKLSRIEDVENDIISQKEKLEDTVASLAKEQKDMDQLLARRKKANDQVVRSYKSTDDNLKKLSKQASNLSDLIAKTTQASKQYAQVSGINFFKLKKKLPLPLSGNIVTKFNQAKIESGVKSKGIEIKTYRSTNLLSPYSGRVIFAGEFKKYGNTFIIDHGNNFYSVLAGIQTLLVGEGQTVLSGEPIGKMGAHKTLYMEFRYKTRNLDPLDFFKR